MENRAVLQSFVSCDVFYSLVSEYVVKSQVAVNIIDAMKSCKGLVIERDKTKQTRWHHHRSSREFFHGFMDCQLVHRRHPSRAFRYAVWDRSLP